MASSIKPLNTLTTEERRYFLQTSNFRGALAVVTTWAIIAASLAFVSAWTNFFTVVVALVVLGGRHLALAILMHDAAHYSLFRTRWLNDFIGTWFCAFPTWQDLKQYRTHHIIHHKFAGTEADPDLDLVLPFPTSRRSLGRKIARDLSGLSGLKRIYGQILMALGYIKFTVSSRVEPLDQTGRDLKNLVATALKNLYGVVLTNGIFFFVLFALGKPWLYFLWVCSYLTTFSLFLRIRSIAEHACTASSLDPMRNTRTTYANAFARLTVAPHYVNYHLEHHLLMTVPSFRLPRLHELLKQRGALSEAHIAHGYLEVLRLASCKNELTTN